jgi:hypothetical protein
LKNLSRIDFEKKNRKIVMRKLSFISLISIGIWIFNCSSAQERESMPTPQVQVAPKEVVQEVKVDSPIFQAIKEDDLKALEALLKEDSKSLNEIVNDRKQSPMTVALKAENLKMVRLLYSYGAEVKDSDLKIPFQNDDTKQIAFCLLNFGVECTTKVIKNFAVKNEYEEFKESEEGGSIEYYSKKNELVGFAKLENDKRTDFLFQNKINFKGNPVYYFRDATYQNADNCNVQRGFTYDNEHRVLSKYTAYKKIKDFDGDCPKSNYVSFEYINNIKHIKTKVLFSFFDDSGKFQYISNIYQNEYNHQGNKISESCDRGSCSYSIDINNQFSIVGVTGRYVSYINYNNDGLVSKHYFLYSNNFAGDWNLQTILEERIYKRGYIYEFMYDEKKNLKEIKETKYTDNPERDDPKNSEPIVSTSNVNFENEYNSEGKISKITKTIEGLISSIKIYNYSKENSIQTLDEKEFSKDGKVINLIQTIYEKNGNIKNSKSTLENGTVSINNYFYDKNKLSKIEVKQGNQLIKVMQYYPNGQLLKEEKYSDSKLIFRKTFFNNGETQKIEDYNSYFIQEYSEDLDLIGYSVLGSSSDKPTLEIKFDKDLKFLKESNLLFTRNFSYTKDTLNIDFTVSKNFCDYFYRPTIFHNRVFHKYTIFSGYNFYNDIRYLGKFSANDLFNEDTKTINLNINYTCALVEFSTNATYKDLTNKKKFELVKHDIVNKTHYRNKIDTGIENYQIDIDKFGNKVSVKKINNNKITESTQNEIKYDKLGNMIYFASNKDGKIVEGPFQFEYKLDEKNRVIEKTKFHLVEKFGKKEKEPIHIERIEWAGSFEEKK